MGKKKCGVTFVKTKTRAQETPVHMFGFSYGDLRSTEARAGLARLCSPLNAPTAACEAEDELRKRSAVEGMLWFG